MAIGYKNLIMIDNSKSVGEANFMLCKETAKYICTNMCEDDECRIAVFGEDISYITDYTGDVEELVDGIEGITLKDRDTYITDNLVNVLKEWKEQDVACRNIILFTDGEEKESLLHANEELYYMLTDLSYPVYVIQSVETRNDEPAKNLSAIATMSDGDLLLTEFEGSEGGSEKIMGTTILDHINERRESIPKETEEEKVTEEVQEIKTEEENEEAMFIESDHTDSAYGEYSTAENNSMEASYPETATSPIIVNNKAKESPFGFSVIFPAVGLVFAIGFAITIYLITHRSNRLKRKDMRTVKRLGYETDSMRIEGRIAEDAEDVDCMTLRLHDDCNDTRILEREEGGYNIVLEDCKDPTRIYRAGGMENLIVGRSRGLCDIVIDHDDSVSGRHCELNVIDGNWYVKDLKSSNGTRVNSQKVFQEFMLKNGDVLRLGQSEFLVTV